MVPFTKKKKKKSRKSVPYNPAMTNPVTPPAPAPVRIKGRSLFFSILSIFEAHLSSKYIATADRDRDAA